MLLLGTSGLLAAIDASQVRHVECAAVIAGRPGPFLLSPFVLAELDQGAYQLEPFDAADVGVAQGVIASPMFRSSSMPWTAWPAAALRSTPLAVLAFLQA